MGWSPEDIARVCHEANRALTHLLQDVPMQPWWDEIDPDMRASVIKGVEYALEHVEATPEDMHRAWCDERRRQGWTYGETKDPIAKTHPALKDFADLPPGVRSKDAVFRAIIKALR